MVVIKNLCQTTVRKDLREDVISDAHEKVNHAAGCSAIEVYIAAMVKSHLSP